MGLDTINVIFCMKCVTCNVILSIKIPGLEFRGGVNEGSVHSKNELVHTCVQFTCPVSCMILREVPVILDPILLICQ
jgi:hypothetical protein